MDKKCSRGKVVIIGSGRSGRGLHGDFCYREEYDLTFADIDLELIKKLKIYILYGKRKWERFFGACDRWVSRISY